MATASVLKYKPLKTFDVNRIPGRPKKRRKITLTFDDKKRQDFLGGFRKRKLQRKKKAQEELEKKLKEEKQRIKQNARERYKKLLSSRGVPELEEILSKEEYELEGRTVSILELNIAELTSNDNFIGHNKVEYDNEVGGPKTDEEEDTDSEEEIPGMGLKNKPVVEKSRKSEESPLAKSKGDVKKIVKLAASKEVQKSKVFQKKQRLERMKSKKLSARKKKLQEKSSKNKKVKGKSKKKKSTSKR